MKPLAPLLLLAGLISVPASAKIIPSVLLETPAATLRIQLNGGVLSDFHLAGDGVNPLQGLGHFLCLDRWGPPSEAEAKSGMPFHGEASKVVWRVTRRAERREGGVEMEMAADLPLAGLSIRRLVRLSDSEAMVEVQESVTNWGKLGRIFNWVQHPTVGAPFLDAETRVDASAGRGFMQSSPLPNPEQPEVRWPNALHQGRKVDLRRLTDSADPNVVSFAVPSEMGWTTAVAPKQQRLIGYVWSTKEYPWFNAWRHVENGKPAFRGLEFGTTGLHQPFPVLVKKGRIFDLPLYTHLDAGETASRGYAMFLARTPAGFEGVKQVVEREGRLTIQERGRASRRLTFAARRRDVQ